MKYYLDSCVTRDECVKLTSREKELLSFLVYFVGYNNNVKLLKPYEDRYNQIKWIMNEKNKPNINAIGKWYES